MKPSRFELLCAAMLGFGQLFMMTGYDTDSFVLEPVIHSIHERDPNVIDQYAGYYGQAVIYTGYMLTCIFSPSILNVTSSKILLVLSSICFSAFQLGFLFTNSYYFYTSSFFVGVGFAFFYQGQGGYMTSHSTRQNIESNVSLTWSLGCCCLLVGSGILALITKLTAGQSSNVSGFLNITAESHIVERRFGDTEITLLFSVLTAISCLSIITHFFLPNNDIENCIESSDKRGTFMDGLKLTYKAFKCPNMLRLIPLFALCGINTSFFLAIFPTAMNFTKHNSNLIYLPAIYSLGAGVGEVSMGLTISVLSKKIKDFGLKPTMVIGTIFTTIYCLLIFVSTPLDASIRPTQEPSILLNHSNIFIFILAIFAGVADCCINSIRGVICALVMPDMRAQSFSVSKLFQAFFCVIIFFISPYLEIYYYTFGLPILAIFTTVLFFSVARRTKSMERKLTIQSQIKQFCDTVHSEKF